MTLPHQCPAQWLSEYPFLMSESCQSSDLEGGKARCKSVWSGKTRPHPLNVSWSPNKVKCGFSGDFLAASWDVETGGCWGWTESLWLTTKSRPKVPVDQSTRKTDPAHAGVCGDVSQDVKHSWGNTPQWEDEKGKEDDETVYHRGIKEGRVDGGRHEGEWCR